jgi:hypothetical protein
LAFIIDRDSRVAWIGSPTGIDEPLKQVVNGTWDLEAAAQAFRVRKTEEAAATRLKVAFDHALSNRRWGEAASLVDTLRSFGGDESSDRATTMSCLIVKWILDSEKIDRDLDIALRCAQQANEWSGGQDPYVLGLVARIHYLRGRWAPPSPCNRRRWPTPTRTQGLIVLRSSASIRARAKTRDPSKRSKGLSYSDVRASCGHPCG